MDLKSGQFLLIIMFFSGNKKWTTLPLLILCISIAKWCQMILYEHDKVTTFIMYWEKVWCNCQHTTKRGIQKKVSSSFKRIWQTVWLAFETFTLQPYYYYTVYCSINRLWVSNAPVNFRLTSVAYWMTLKWCKLSKLLTTVQWTWSISGAL